MLKSVVCMVLAAAWSAAGGDAAPAGAIERAVDDYRRGPGPSNFAAYSAAEALLAREYRRAEGLPPTNGFDDVDNAALLFVHAAGLFPSRTNLAAALICPKRPGRAGDRQNFFLREDEWKARGSNILAMSDSAFVLFNAARLIGAPGAEYPELTNALAAVYRRSEDWSLSRECAAALERHGARPNIADCAGASRRAPQHRGRRGGLRGPRRPCQVRAAVFPRLPGSKVGRRYGL